MTVPEINQGLFRKVHDQISRKPESLNQGAFESACGSTRCVAGWGLHFAGDGESIHDLADRINEDEEHAPALRDSDLLGWIGATAAHLFGLTEEEAHQLFYGSDESEALALVERYALKGRE